MPALPLRLNLVGGAKVISIAIPPIPKYTPLLGCFINSHLVYGISVFFLGLFFEMCSHPENEKSA
jgi:hypothetical protein